MPPLVLATVDDVRAALQDPGLDEAEARAAIDRVTDRIAGLLPPGVLDFVEHDTIELRGGGSRELRLPGPFSWTTIIDHRARDRVGRPAVRGEPGQRLVPPR